MINQNSVDAVNDSKLGKDFRKPLYDSYCFSNIPNTILSAFSNGNLSKLPDDVFSQPVNDVNKVFLIFLDAFGWIYFDKYKDQLPFLKRIVEQGVASKLTSQFPSTTAAHVTTIHSGLPLIKHGVSEWRYYEPLVDEIIEPMTFSISGDKERNTLHRLNVDPREIYPQKTLYNELKILGVESFVFSASEYADSPYNKLLEQGATSITYRTMPEALIQLHKIVNSPTNSKKQYFYLYFDPIDTISHKYGNDSKEVEAEITTMFFNLEKFFYELTFSNLDKGVLMLISDHGHTNIDLSKVIYLNQAIPELSQYIKRNNTGKLLVPGGACRVMYLYIQAEHVSLVKKLLTQKLKNLAEVFTSEELIERGLFGSGEASSDLTKRLGDIIIVPYDNQAIWWYEKDKFDVRKIGNHGGLSVSEMETVFLSLTNL